MSEIEIVEPADVVVTHVATPKVVPVDVGGSIEAAEVIIQAQVVVTGVDS